MSENNKRKQNSGPNSGSKALKPLPTEISHLYEDFGNWLRSIKYSRPTCVEDLLPQYYENSRERPNIRLAALFSILIEFLPNLTFKERVEIWAKNIIHHLGDHVGHHMYRCWQYHVILDPQHDMFYEQVRGCLFFTDFHNLCNSLGQYGEILYFEVMSKTWDLLRNGEEMWSREREVTDSVPYRDAYRLELNAINRRRVYLWSMHT